MESVYFGLLWEHELELLKPLLERVAAKRDAVLAQWWELYGLHLAESYFNSRSAVAAARLGGLERQAARPWRCLLWPA